MKVMLMTSYARLLVKLTLDRWYEESRSTLRLLLLLLRHMLYMCNMSCRKPMVFPDDRSVVSFSVFLRDNLARDESLHHSLLVLCKDILHLLEAVIGRRIGPKISEDSSIYDAL